MQYQNSKIRFSRALTLVEMVIAMAIMAIIFAAILPQFRAIQNSWASKQAAAETLQNSRVLMEHLYRNFSKAVKITAVSDSSETNGYIEFEDTDENIFRYDIAASNYVEFGPVGDLYELAGPVSQLQFICYDGNDFDTAITDVNDIRFIKLQTTLTNPAAMGHDKTFTAQIYLRANANSGTGRLVGWWKLDESSGLTAADSSGNGNDGTLTNMSGDEWTAGLVNGALDFDGSNDCVEVPDDSTFDIANEITVAAWINPDDTAAYRTIVSKFAHAPGWRKDLYWFLYNGKIGACLAGPCGVGGTDWSPNVPIATGTWTHVALTYDGSTMIMYKDGVNAATKTVSGTLKLAESTSDEPFYIGKNTEWGEYFRGSIDDVWLCNRALNSEEVAQLAGVLEAHYKFDDGGQLLVSWFKLDETTGTTAADSSGNGNDGTLTDMDPATDWVTGQVGGALDFDGANDYVEVPDDSTFDIADEITLTAWINPNDSAAWMTIISKFASGARKDIYWYLYSGKIGIALAGPRYGDWTTNIAIATGSWIHVAAVYDGSSIKMYKNAVNEDTFNGLSGALMLADFSSNQSFYVGRNTVWGEYFYGTIDDVRVYNCALSPGQIATILAGGTLTSTSSQTAADSSGNSNDATLGSTDESDVCDPDWVAGAVGTGALSFDGVDDFIHTADSDTLLLLSGDYFISVWIKPDASQNQWAGIYAKTNSSGTKEHWTLQFNNQGDRKIVVCHDGSNTWNTGMRLADVAGDWHKIQISRSDTTMSAYLDGALIKSGTFDHSPTAEPGHLNIGADRIASSSYVFKGLIDELRIYDLAGLPTGGGGGINP